MSNGLSSGGAIRYFAGLLLIVLGAATTSGCATWSTSSVDSKEADVATMVSKKTPVAQIRIIDTDIGDKKYASLGDITVTVNKTTLFHPNPTTELVNEKLKEKAAELGADAVIFVRYGNGGVSFMSWGSLEGKGRAIRYVP